MITLTPKRRKARTIADENVNERTSHHSTMNHDDCLADVLSRDQRTCPSLTRSSYDNMRVEHVTNSSERVEVRTDNSTTTSNSSLKQSHRDSSHRRSRYSPRWTNLTKLSLHRLSEVFLISVCLASLLAKPTMSAPTSPAHQRPKWINPCGFGSSDDIDSELVDLGLRLNDQQLLTQIVVQAKSALMHADLFKDNYVKNTFNVDIKQLHASWINNRYKWLPSETNIPKTLGEPTPVEHLEGLELDQALKDSYTYMQKLAVGLEQVVWDQNREHGDYRRDFTDTENKLRATLCEIQVAILERNVKPYDDMTRDLMKDEFRNMGNDTYRNIRDWLIFRDYMNGLEYIIQVFEYFQHKLTS